MEIRAEIRRITPMLSRNRSLPEHLSDRIGAIIG
jgi:hypothetical protein